MSKNIIVTNNNGGYGGPLKIRPTEEKNKFMYLLSSGDVAPEVTKISELTGMTAINGYTEKVQEEELALVVIDCGGSLRCGVYPRKGIPTINLEPTGRSGLLWQYMTEDLYVSGSDVSNINVLEEE